MTTSRWGGLRRRVAVLPLRVRLVAGFVVAVTGVLALASAFVYWRVAYALDRRVNNDLRADAASVTSALRDGGRIVDDGTATSATRRFQLVDPRGHVLSYGNEVGPALLLSPSQLERARQRQIIANIGGLLPASRRPLRVLAEPLAGAPRGTVLVLADRRDERDEALRELLGQLSAAGLASLLVTAVVGDRLARAALAPVERYRAQAERIAGGATGVRLDVPAVRNDEVTRLGHTLNDVLDALEQALARERQFTQDASHELRTPLTLLSARVQLALRRDRTTAEHEQVLRELDEDVQALATLAEQLLDLTTAEDLNAADSIGGDLRDAANRVVAEHSGGTGAVSLAGSPSHPVPVAMPDRSLRQVLSNLIGNALLHGRPPVTVHIQGTSDAVAALTVHDAGDGIEPAFLPSAAERFARSDRARSRPGAGLGLALVRSLVQAYGGELRLCSGGQHYRYGTGFAQPCQHIEGGTTVTVLLPTRPGSG